MVGRSELMLKISEVIEKVAASRASTVLIQGDSGTGKELVAKAIHFQGDGRDKPFMEINCSSLPETLLESELFGYEKGAFTGAHQRKPGKFEFAHKGTIFLDEIAEMSPGLQAKLLQVLQDGEFNRLGGNRDIRVDVRVVCATNRKLEQMVKEGGFREDLFFRLNVVSVMLPPLRDRREEIPRLAESFARRFAVRYGKPIPEFSSRLMNAFERYSFPGNVRELENMIKRVVVLGGEEAVLAEMVRNERASRHSNDALRALLEEVEQTAGEVPLREVGRRAALQAEREAIDRVLHYTNWNRKQAARLLGVSYKTLLQKIRGCGLAPG
jgi:transcriptional regulator with GAF, ATPase, and Fis domain